MLQQLADCKSYLLLKQTFAGITDDMINTFIPFVGSVSQKGKLTTLYYIENGALNMQFLVQSKSGSPPSSVCKCDNFIDTLPHAIRKLNMVTFCCHD